MTRRAVLAFPHGMNLAELEDNATESNYVLLVYASQVKFRKCRGGAGEPEWIVSFPGR